MRRRVAVLLAGIVVSGVIFSLHHLTGWIVNRGDYTPFTADPRISAQVYDETEQYVAGVSRFFRTGQLPAEVDIVELRDLRNSYPVLPSLLLGLLAKATGSVERGWMIGHALWPALVWAVFFWNAGLFVESELLAAAIAWFVCFVAFGPRNFLLLGWEWSVQPLELGRMPQPALSFLFLILAAVLLSLALAKPTLTNILLAGMSSGTLFYMYYYYWIAFFAGAGSLLMLLLLMKRWEWSKTTAIVLAVGSLAAVPFLWWTIQATRSGQQRDLMMRVGNFSRGPDGIGILLALVLVPGLWLYLRFFMDPNHSQRSLLGAVLLAVIVGGAIGLNFQLVTGYYAQHGHFFNRVLEPFVAYFVLTALASASFFTVRFRRWLVPASIAAIALLLGVAAFREITVGKNTATYLRRSNPDMDVLLWSRDHLSAESVVGARDRNLVNMIPAIAGTWTFVPLGNQSMASNEESLRRYLLLCRMEGEEWPQAQANLRADAGFRSNGSSMSYAVIEQRTISPDNLRIAKTIWDHLDLPRDLASRRLDYWIVGQGDTIPGNYETLFQNSRWRVLRLPARQL